MSQANPMIDRTLAQVPLENVVTTSELSRRSTRAPNYEIQSQALEDLAKLLSISPQAALKGLADQALKLCGAESAGISIAETENDNAIFRWHATSGELASYVNGTMPRHFTREHLVSTLAEAAELEHCLMCMQLKPDEVKISGIRIVNSLDAALKAIQLIVEQGEGSRSRKNSHFEQFSAIKAEFDELRLRNPAFNPSRPVARNPVMLRQVSPEGTLLIDHPESVIVLDACNAIYTLMLRFLLQIYSMASRSAQARKVLIAGAFKLMHVTGQAATALSKLPASKSNSTWNAGITFEVNRHLSSLELTSEKTVLTERLDEIIEVAGEIGGPDFTKIGDELKGIRVSLEACRLC